MNTPGFWFAVAFLLLATILTIADRHTAKQHKGKYCVSERGCDSYSCVHWTTTIKPLPGGCVQIDTGEIICGSFTIRKQN